MHKQIQNIKAVRAFALEMIKDLSNEQLNKIPTGFKNNIIWNLGHLVVTHYSICYRPTGIKVPLEEEFYLNHKPGATARNNVSDAEIKTIKELLLTNVDAFTKDFESKETFANYNTWKTPYGVEITNIEDAINFVNFHEGLHIGYIMALRKLV